MWLPLLIVACLVGFQQSATAQVPTQSKAVMIQAFHWDSNSETSWSNLYQISGELSGNFDLVWLPPSAFSSGGTGYMPKQWSNQNSAWGDAGTLKQLINRLKTNDTRAIADIVVNHRDTKSSWIDFYEDNFGQYGTFQFDTWHIVKDDEAVWNGHLSASQAGANDTGENFDGARDLDHTHDYVQNAVRAYLQWMKNEMGYDGWRYDMVKGFSGWYLDGYNYSGGAYISVGEYWDANYDNVMGWVNNTNQKSTAFDFPMKYAALNNGLAAGNFGNMAWWDGSTNKNRPAGLIHNPYTSKFSVTFVDNHDTYRDHSKYNGDVLQANAYILSSPGIPCVFYPHWRDHKAAINAMIKARKSVGLHNESDVEVQNTSGYYKAYSKGTCGEMLTYIGGSGWDVPNGGGWTLAASGNGYAMYTNITDQSCSNDYQTKHDNGVNPTTNNIIGGTKFYLTPNMWSSDGARFAIYFYGDGDAWVSMTPVPGVEGMYEATSPSGKNFSNLIYVRLKPDNQTNSWGNMWNQTNDLVYDGANNHYTITGWGQDNSVGEWSRYIHNTPSITLSVSSPVYLDEQISFSATTYNVDNPVVSYSIKKSDNGGYVSATSPYTHQGLGTYSIQADLKASASGPVLASDSKTVVVKAVPDDIVIKMGNSIKWNNIHMFVWNSKNNDGFKKMTKDSNGWYSYTFSREEKVDFLFVNGNDWSLEPEQTEDLSTDESNCYEVKKEGTDIEVVEADCGKVWTAIEQLDLNQHIRVVNQTIQVSLNNLSNVELISSSGQLLRNESAIKEFSQQVNKGVYLLRINKEPYKLIVK